MMAMPLGPLMSILFSIGCHFGLDFPDHNMLLLYRPSACHVRAFEFFEGTSRLIVPDNPRTGVTRAKVENAVLVAERWILRGVADKIASVHEVS